MNKKKPIYLSISEFSKLTGVPKERLRFYDEEGIISPAKKDEETGYRYYLPEQIYHIYMIIILVRYDYYSLDEIRNFINDPTTKFSDILKFQLPILKEKMELSKKQLTYIHNSISHNEYFEKFKEHTPYVLNYLYPPTYVTPIFPKTPVFTSGAVESLATHVAVSLNDPDTLIVPVAMLIDCEEFYNGNYRINSYYNVKFIMSYEELCKTSIEKKSIIYCFHGPVGQVKSVLDSLHKYMEENNYALMPTESVHISVMATTFRYSQNTECDIRIIIPICDATDENNQKHFTSNPNSSFQENDNAIRYTSGQFAQLCNISKETLRFYDRNKILQPSEVDEKGYKYFKNDQLMHYYCIKMLQKAGCTIKEIKKMMIEQQASQIDILKICLSRQEKIARRFEHYYKMTKSILDIRATYPKEAKKGDIFIANLQFIPHRFTYSKKKMDIYSKEAIVNMTKHTSQYYTPEKLVYFPLALSMMEEDFLNESFLLCGHSMFDFTQYENLSDLPLQKYVCQLLEINYNEIPEKLKLLREYILTNNYTISGMIRIIITLESLNKTLSNTYLVYFYIPIEE